MTITTRLLLAICIPIAACRERASPRATQDAAAVPTHAEHTDTAPPLSAARARVNGIGVDQTSPQVRTILGAPDSVPAPLRYKGPGDSMTTWFYPTTKIYFVGDRVRGVVCRGQPCQTPDGISSGDSLSKVQRVYGPTFALAPPGTGHHKLIYPTAEGGNCSMEFDFDLGVITKISLGCD